MTDFLNLPPYRKPYVKKAKVVQGPTKYDHKKLYYDARRIMFERDNPVAWDAGHYFDKDYPKISETNGFTRYIEDVINNLGHHAERVNTMGVPVKQKDGSIKFRRSGSTKGSTDIHCEIKIPTQALPVGWKIEVKNKDTVLKAQVKYAAKMQRVGVLHSIIRVGELDLFWDEYYRIMQL